MALSSALTAAAGHLTVRGSALNVSIIVAGDPSVPRAVPLNLLSPGFLPILLVFVALVAVVVIALWWAVRLRRRRRDPPEPSEQPDDSEGEAGPPS